MSFWNKLRIGRGQTALCLNSSFFGFFAHAGFLAGLEEIGHPPDELSGASAGALVAGLYSAGISPAEMADVFTQPELALTFREWSAPVRIARTLLSRRGATGALTGQKVLDLLKRYLGERRLEDCELPLAISVANMSHNRSEVKTSGPLAEYILASCAVPGMFTTQQVEGHHFWDGGIADPVPIEHWLDRPEIKRIIVHIADSNQRPRPNESLRFWGSMTRSHEIISDEFLRLKTDLARARGKQLIVVVTRTPRLGPHKLAEGHANIRRGRESVLRQRDLFR